MQVTIVEDHRMGMAATNLTVCCIITEPDLTSLIDVIDGCTFYELCYYILVSLGKSIGKVNKTLNFNIANIVSRT